MNFFTPYPDGNGRACATCHNPDDGYSLSPKTVETRWQRLQLAKRADANADDPLFRSIDADDGIADFTMLRTRALVKVRVPLPPRVRLTDAPHSTEVTVQRSVPALSGLKHTAPYQQDRTMPTLEDQVRAALIAHMQATKPPSEEFVAKPLHTSNAVCSPTPLRAVSRQRSMLTQRFPTSILRYRNSNGAARRNLNSSAASVTAVPRK